jgi:hypothetical protein
MKNQFIITSRTKRSAFLLLALIGCFPIILASCSNPDSAPGFNTAPADYSASAFFNTVYLGDSSKTPFPFCYPAEYLQERLGLTDSQAVAIQNLQDSLQLALQTQIAALKASGSLTLDSVRSLRLEYQTDLYTGIAAILTPAQLAELQTLSPPIGPRDRYIRIPINPNPGNFGHPRDTAYANLTVAQRDSIQLAHIETTLALAGDTLSANQITLIQNLQDTIASDTTLTPEGRRAEFNSQLQNILTAKQYADLRPFLNTDDRWRRWRR